MREEMLSGVLLDYSPESLDYLEMLQQKRLLLDDIASLFLKGQTSGYFFGELSQALANKKNPPVLIPQATYRMVWLPLLMGPTTFCKGEYSYAPAVDPELAERITSKAKSILDGPIKELAEKDPN
jgi:hypothetical protein